MVVAKLKKPIRVRVSRRAKKRVIPFVPPISPNNSIQITELPCEILIKIFSYLTIQELFYNVRPVNKKFKAIAMSPTLWKEIEVGNEIPTGTLSFWIKSAKFLKHFGIKHRNDANYLTEELSKCCKNLESIKLQNCWGSRRNYLLHSTPLCNLVTRCPKLSNFNFSQSRFMSCKFFRLIAKNERCASTRKCNYTGPMTPKQMKALFAALQDYEVHETATIGNVNYAQKFNLRDIVRYVWQTTPNPVNAVWENINYGDTEGGVDNNFVMDVDM